MTKKKIAVLGATGSIGKSTLALLQEKIDLFEIVTLTANTNAVELAHLANKHQPKNIVIKDDSKHKELSEILHFNNKVNVYAGEDDFYNLLTLEYDIVIVGISGIAAIKPLFKALESTKLVGLANKESIICAGELIIKKANNLGVKIIPLDSEHNAIFQLLQEKDNGSIEKVVLTASGGPFLNFPLEKLKNITPSQAVKHPNWSMGAKISVDCANMMNKGLEIIEACQLFNFNINNVDAIIHPQSIMHTLVHYCDGSVLSQLAWHDMRTAISTALNHPNRLAFNYPKINFHNLNLSFHEIDKERYPMFFLAKEVYKKGMCQTITMNVTNEIAVSKFLQNKIGFLEIYKIVSQAIDKTDIQKLNVIDDALEYIEACALKNKDL